MALKSTERTLRRCMRKLMREKHLKKITVDDICEMAEIGRRTFYRYYPDKYALFEDTYRREFFEKLEIEDDAYIYDIYEKILVQMYEEQAFFQHAIAAKEQNGFWELVTDLLFSRVVVLLSSDPYINQMRDFYIRKDIGVILHIIEQWILNGYRETPEELSKFIRLCAAVHGKWEYQLAMKYETDEYSLERFEKGEW